MTDRSDNGTAARPTITIVFVVYNRRDDLRESLERMLFQSDYDRELVDVIVVDNASTDGSADMVREEFPQVQLIARETNIGAPAWNEGYARARGDYVLTLDDDCYLEPAGLSKAVAAAREHDADLVSFRVVSTEDPDHDFTKNYRTGLFSFWGCAWLISRGALQELGGYDPQIFMWANELELMLRFYDRGYRHLHDPEIVAYHMKRLGSPGDPVDVEGYKRNARHWGYVAGKLLRPRDAVEALIALTARCVRDSIREDGMAIRGVPVTLAGFVRGLVHRQAVRNAELSRFYRRNFETFASPWWLSRPPSELVRALPRETVRRVLMRESRPDDGGRRPAYYAERARHYPDEPAVLDFASGKATY